MKLYYLLVKTNFCIGMKLERLEKEKMLCFMNKKHIVQKGKPLNCNKREVDESTKAYHHHKYNSVITLHIGHSILYLILKVLT